MTTIGLERQQTPELEKVIEAADRASDRADAAYDEASLARKAAESAAAEAKNATTAANTAITLTEEASAKFDKAEEEFKKTAERVDGIQETLSTEINERTAKDVELQEQIDVLENKSDVVDVVSTYAELRDYDKSTLGDNDIIKVLTDETHNSAIAYYRYIKSEDDFKYVGSVGPYYTKSEIDEKIGDVHQVLEVIVSGEGV